MSSEARIAATSESFTDHSDFIVAFRVRKLLVRWEIAPKKEYPSRAIMNGEEDDEDGSEDEALVYDEVPASVNDLPNIVAEEVFYGPEDRTVILYSADQHKGTGRFLGKP
ncbi:hypothetical protein O1611_g3441 [Lasiodiplodia mahajangana]|uniref:Uncharacterized protein n=1 Tax=Lasiodiplodia mahajangana TaxID=1108764 RepID=A0ACC2JRT2_9PEZI|nr:hypothetical protein O1611_g3441 [Lasiodiplodia mahajangana]